MYTRYVVLFLFHLSPFRREEIEEGGGGGLFIAEAFSQRVLVSLPVGIRSIRRNSVWAQGCL